MRGAKVPERPDSGKPVARRHCPHGDPFCPCQDGDAYHYEGVAAWPTGVTSLYRGCGKARGKKDREGAHLVSLSDRDELVSQVAAKHRVSVVDLLSGRMKRDVTLARWECMWTLRKRTLPNGAPRHSYPAIAKALGLYDHTSVIHGVRRYRAWLDEQRVAA